MRVALTGGSGVVGRAVLRHAVAAGHEVRALARTDDAVSLVQSLGADPIRGDVLDTGSLDTLVTGSDLVFHVAGVNETCSTDPGRMWRVNVEGTANVIAAAARAGARRLVHTSSAVTIGEGRGEVGAESTRRSRGFLSEYERTKTAAEALALAEGTGIEVVAVNPASVQGPGRSTGTGALLLAAARGKLPLLADTTFSLVDIDDCARGHLLAADRGVPGERYLLSGAVLTVRQALQIMSGITEGIPRPWFLEAGAIRLVAPFVAGTSRLFGRRPPLCPESARVLLHGHRYDGSRATRELGLDYTPVEQTFSRALDWYRAEGLL
ncbi:MAG TPA: NAD-dependent epimerase/dehydratase family protein [Acidimicrobiia bacterium]|jgi:dihydroflavonol-4-reductase|nr:NAD-dependent epimerase/dehydratase family protein [Acidimicrobiia bacterium]